MNKKSYKLISLFVVFFTMFMINIKFTNAQTISLPDYCTNPSSYGDIVNGHLCASSDVVSQCNVANFASGDDYDENGGKPTECGSECEGYYYSFSETSDSMFVLEDNSIVYRQMICNGLTYNGKKLNYLYLQNDKIKSVETNNKEFYNKVKNDIENNVADSEMGKEEAKQDAKNDKIKNTDVNGLDENSTDISINCSDFSALHTIYTILLIVAPILVIVLGTIDYSKAVMASNLEKMEKFKKRFKPRLIALIILFLVPLLIKLIVSLNADLSNSMLNCVVNGKDAEIKLNASKSTGSTGLNTGSIKTTQGKSSTTNNTNTTNTTSSSGNSSSAQSSNVNGSSGNASSTDNTTQCNNCNKLSQSDKEKCRARYNCSNSTTTTTNKTSTGDCSKCAKIPSSHASERAKCEKANNCQIMNIK